MKTFWDKRYSSSEYAYGIEPNDFFKIYLNKLNPGKLLLPLEGEGRNAVYAAKLGWSVDAFDFSSSGYTKAIQLAQLEKVSINYKISEVTRYEFGREQYDLIGLFYTHLPYLQLSHLLEKVQVALKTNGLVIFEAFSQQQLQYASGGPKKKEMLFSESQLQSALNSLEISLLNTELIVLEEGKFHRGPASVIRLIGKKP